MSCCRFGCCLGRGLSRTHQPGKDASRGPHEIDESRSSGRYFRYAPLSSRTGNCAQRPWGSTAIAVIQTTAIDNATDTVNLTTLLAHSSGEWIASDWPVCSVARPGHTPWDGGGPYLCAPLRSFTLVGIAGEDDDRCAGSQYSETSAAIGTADDSGGATTGGADQVIIRRRRIEAAALRARESRVAVLGPDQSRYPADGLLASWLRAWIR